MLRVHKTIRREVGFCMETLTFLLILLTLQMLSSLLMDWPAIAIFFLMSAVTLPSLVTLAPRYVKLSTSSISQFVTLRLAVLFCWPSALCNKLQTGLSWVVSQRCFLVLEMIHSRRQRSNVVREVDVFKHGGEVPSNSGAFFFDCLSPSLS